MPARKPTDIFPATVGRQDFSMLTGARLCLLYVGLLPLLGRAQGVENGQFEFDRARRVAAQNNRNARSRTKDAKYSGNRNPIADRPWRRNWPRRLFGFRASA
jgi:hypothetical protein